MDDIIRVFLYDELMNESVFKEYGLEYLSKSSVTLSAHKRVFNKVPLDNKGIEELGQANIEPTDDNLGMMIGVLHEMDAKFLPKLDEIYQHPNEYKRTVMKFQRHDFTPAKGFIYFALPENTKPGLKPSKEMMKKFRGAKKAMDMLHFARLMNTQTCD